MQCKSAEGSTHLHRFTECFVWTNKVKIIIIFTAYFASTLADHDLRYVYSVTVGILLLTFCLDCYMRNVCCPFRKGTIVNTTVLVFLAGALMGFSRICNSPEMVIFGRFITGIHSGTLAHKHTSRHLLSV